MGWNQFWLAQSKAAESPPKIAANQVNIHVSLMALRSCNVVCYKTVCAQHKCITLKNKLIRRLDFSGHPSYCVHVNLMKVWLKLFESEQILHWRKSHSWVSRNKCILYQLNKKYIFSERTFLEIALLATGRTKNVVFRAGRNRHETDII